MKDAFSNDKFRPTVSDPSLKDKEELSDEMLNLQELIEEGSARREVLLDTAKEISRELSAQSDILEQDPENEAALRRTDELNEASNQNEAELQPLEISILALRGQLEKMSELLSNNAS